MTNGLGRVLIFLKTVWLSQAWLLLLLPCRRHQILAAALQPWAWQYAGQQARHKQPDQALSSSSCSSQRSAAAAAPRGAAAAADGGWQAGGANAAAADRERRAKVHLTDSCLCGQQTWVVRHKVFVSSGGSAPSSSMMMQVAVLSGQR